MNNNNQSSYPTAIINTIMMILISYIMQCRLTTKKPSHLEAIQEIKLVFEASIKTFPKRKLAQEIKGIGLENFLASTEPPDNQMA